jgi:allantoinase
VVTARARGLDVTCETCAHYLFFTDEDVELIGANAKCAPPIRDAAERDALWQSVRTGEIAMITSDHSPSPPEMKQQADFFAIWGGIAGCQSTLPVVLTAGFHQRRIRLETIASATSGMVARRFSLPDKGRIAVGADADCVIVALNAHSTLEETDLHDRHRLSPYIGRQFTGKVERTILRGRTIFLDGQVVGQPTGRFLRPERLRASGTECLGN